VTEEPIAALVNLGFTALEAEVYAFLLQESPATGYRVAQAIGKPVANTYKAIESLQRKGALLVDEGGSRQCVAVPSDELLRGMEQAFRERSRLATEALAGLRGPGSDTRVYQLQTADQVMERARAMLRRCEQTVLLDLFPGPYKALSGDIARCAAAGKTVALQAYETCEIEGVQIMQNPTAEGILDRYPGQWLIVNLDGAEVLLAFFSKDMTTVLQAVWSGSAFLSHLHHSGMASELTLIGMLSDSEKMTDAAEWRERAWGIQRLFRPDALGYRMLLQQFGSGASNGAKVAMHVNGDAEKPK
jgi:sugar-specific transcriptional regulator TrmB